MYLLDMFLNPAYGRIFGNKLLGYSDKAVPTHIFPLSCKLFAEAIQGNLYSQVMLDGDTAPRKRPSPSLSRKTIQVTDAKAFMTPSTALLMDLHLPGVF